MMYKALLLSFLVTLGCSISPGIHKEAGHKVTSQCCLAKAGKVCGTVVKDCCKSECELGLLNSKWCKNN